MAEEFKSIRENLFKVLTGLGNAPRAEDEDEGLDVEAKGGLGLDSSAARALIAAIFSKAGKSKDEIVTIIAREIGLAVAAMLKEPLSQLAKHQKLQISFEFVPKDGARPEGDEDAGEPGKKAPTPRKRRFKTAAAVRRKPRNHKGHS